LKAAPLPRSNKKLCYTDDDDDDFIDFTNP
jgi:hypothetical protein